MVEPEWNRRERRSTAVIPDFTERVRARCGVLVDLASKCNAWDNFEDSDDEELAGGKLERATYQVLAPQVTIYEAPDDATNKLGFRRAGERLFCDARAGNWVRLSQTFVLGKGFDRRGWVLIEGNADVGRFLKNWTRNPSQQRLSQ